MSGDPAATFDALVIADNQTTAGDGVTTTELHVFSYLACLFALYDGKEPTWWDYSFVGTSVGAPYSVVLAEAADILTASGLLERSQGTMEITSAGRRELEVLAAFDSYVPRQRYVSAACSCALALPLASMGEMLKNEPQLRSTIGLMQSRTLLDEAGVALLKPHFDGLRQVLTGGEEPRTDQDLMVLGAVWLSYLASEANKGTLR